MSAKHFHLLFLVVFKLVVQIYCVEEDSVCGDGMSCLTLPECRLQLKQQCQFVRNSILFKCNHQKVCCPLATHENQENCLTTREKEENNTKINLLPNEKCGITSSTQRITRGKEAGLGQFPWMALLGARMNTGKFIYTCGGTLINNRYILTAAHCLQQVNLTLESIRLGEHNTEADEDCDEDYCTDPVQDYEIDKIIPHKMFNAHTYKNDIGLIRLKTKVPKYTVFVKPICLPFGTEEKEDRKYEIAGWGKLNSYESRGSPKLQFANVIGVPLQECDPVEPKFVRPLSETQLCASGKRGEEPCVGDSGGPLMDVAHLATRQKPQIFQFGIVSFGSKPCGNNEAPPSVYTRVSAYSGWILDHIEE